MPEMTAERIAAEIRRAYGATESSRPNSWMTLADLADMVDLTQAQIVTGILYLERTDRMFLAVPESNQKVLTDRERAAEVVIGNQRNHLIGWR